jgi:uncharacterized pyridoxal phosphate-containing UPF0001 family protein
MKPVNAFLEKIKFRKWQRNGTMPKDIQWHMIGHVQTNKVKYMAPLSLIHGVESFKLLQEINKQALKKQPSNRLLIANLHSQGR